MPVPFDKLTLIDNEEIVMQVNYSVFVDGNRKPFKSGSMQLQSVAHIYAQPQHKAAIIRDVVEGKKVVYTNRRKGLKLVLTNPNKTVKLVSKQANKFLRIKLDGVQSPAQIQVAAADMLKSRDGWHRTVCMVEANGIEYKVKCMHKGLTYAETVHRCKIVEKKVL